MGWLRFVHKRQKTHAGSSIPECPLQHEQKANVSLAIITSSGVAKGHMHIQPPSPHLLHNKSTASSILPSPNPPTSLVAFPRRYQSPARIHGASNSVA